MKLIDGILLPVRWSVTGARRIWNDAGKFTTFQWLVIYLLTITTLGTLFTVGVEYLLWSKLGGAP